MKQVSGSDPWYQMPFQILKTSIFYESWEEIRTQLMLWKPKYRILPYATSNPTQLPWVQPVKYSQLGFEFWLSSAILGWIPQRSQLWEKDSRTNSLSGKHKSTRRKGKVKQKKEAINDEAVIKPATTVRQPELASLGKWYKIKLLQWFHLRREKACVCIYWLSSVIGWELRDINLLILSVCHTQIEKHL